MRLTHAFIAHDLRHFLLYGGHDVLSSPVMKAFGEGFNACGCIAQVIPFLQFYAKHAARNLPAFLYGLWQDDTTLPKLFIDTHLIWDNESSWGHSQKRFKNSLICYLRGSPTPPVCETQPLRNLSNDVSLPENTPFGTNARLRTQYFTRFVTGLDTIGDRRIQTRIANRCHSVNSVYKLVSPA
ncbi:hypothetical protein DACRYDRAFT_25179 [Dacryopinax primogenitus]|uniref:Uncharacterized protein n=1 Tax=Dacryopinax primogenitus (strain DJM 731) TaxID=1858805 RepID=M5FPZ4_DACPD|nr:uncharacterized protein DACRYDRAFT_25179 [Dacryopinax primogenitus]EJT97433.1 hypothetical protein DACRYDRAFT_25179 [Dacryopinax primogenitus]